MKIGRNDLCPCGSGKKYKMCCLGKEDDEYYTNPTNLAETYKKLRKKSKIKQCLHPNKKECSEKIIGAHSIQNNKIIKRISSDGLVYMPCPKADNAFLPITEYGRKEATVFTGFCGYHDKVIFQPIEDSVFDKSIKHIFLYTYRCFAIEYHKKQEAVNMGKNLYKLKPSLIEMHGNNNPFKGMEIAINDFQFEKEKFDEALLSENYDILTSIVWEFDQVIKFAGTGFEAMTFDLEGNKIQDLTKLDASVKHIFVMIFPEEEKTFCIISWIKEYDDFFSSYKAQLEKLTLVEQKIYINNLLPMISENIVINPEAWDNWDKNKRDEFCAIEMGMATFGESIGISFDRLKAPIYNLFEL
ncbi:YecA family protein [Anaerotignum propionicum]|uniref:YecA family protein n=1 Tax=Anaerotignum propionicum TaxID=28446 RepID=UPI00210E455D|nr:SEC-C metal-binding domain-containing protein [Anaerotignum propionicum]MCQ4935547.1 SEC-C metal-binding domain-containing protein [Anaerotignum propionicum]